jgi:hypothetical protein
MIFDHWVGDFVGELGHSITLWYDPRLKIQFKNYPTAHSIMRFAASYFFTKCKARFKRNCVLRRGTIRESSGWDPGRNGTQGSNNSYSQSSHDYNHRLTLVM